MPPSPPNAILYLPDGATLPSDVAEWLGKQSVGVLTVVSADELMAIALRGRPRIVIFDGRVAVDDTLGACERLKGDSYTGVVPVVMLAQDGLVAFQEGFAAGADEQVQPGLSANVVRCRMDAVLNRSDGDDRTVRRLLRRPRSLQGIQRPLQLQSGRPCHPDCGDDPA